VPGVVPPLQFVFSASGDGTIKVWNLENQLVVQTLKRHEDGVNALVWSGATYHGSHCLRFILPPHSTRTPLIMYRRYVP